MLNDRTALPGAGSQLTLELERNNTSLVVVDRRPGPGAEDGSHNEVELPVTVDVAPAQAVNAADLGHGDERPWFILTTPLHRKREPASGWLVHLELVSDCNLGLAVAVEV